MVSAIPGTTRAWSRSSRRTSQRPPWWRASTKLPTAASSDPRCKDPVGEGAKRPTYGWGVASAVAVVAIAVLAFAPLAPLLRLDAQRRDRTRLQALDADLFAGLEAIAIGAVFDALDRVVDLANELALAVAGAQLQAEFLFLGRAIVGVGEVRGLVLHVRDGAIDFLHEVTLPGVEDAAEVLELLLAHVQLAALDDVRLNVARAGEQAPGVHRIAVLAVHGGHCRSARGGRRAG